MRIDEAQAAVRVDNTRVARVGRGYMPRCKRPYPSIIFRHSFAVLAVKVAREQRYIVLGGAVVLLSAVCRKVGNEREEVGFIKVFNILLIEIAA